MVGGEDGELGESKRYYSSGATFDLMYEAPTGQSHMQKYNCMPPKELRKFWNLEDLPTRIYFA